MWQYYKAVKGFLGSVKSKVPGASQIGFLGRMMAGVGIAINVLKSFIQPLAAGNYAKALDALLVKGLAVLGAWNRVLVSLVHQIQHTNPSTLAFWSLTISIFGFTYAFIWLSRKVSGYVYTFIGSDTPRFGVYIGLVFTMMTLMMLVGDSAVAITGYQVVDNRTVVKQNSIPMTYNEKLEDGFVWPWMGVAKVATNAPSIWGEPTYNALKNAPIIGGYVGNTFQKNLGKISGNKG